MTKTRVLSLLSLPLLILTTVSCQFSYGWRRERPGETAWCGSEFPGPALHQVVQGVHAAHPEVQIDYQSVGSGSGVKAVIDKTVDFGASDAAMTPEEIAKVDAGVQLLPMTAGSIVLAYNLEGVDNLKLSREAYVGIFLGKVTKWNDPAIAASQSRREACRTATSTWWSARTAAAPLSSSRSTSAPSARSSRRAPERTRCPTGRWARSRKGTKESPRPSAPRPGAIGYIEYGYAKGAKLKMATLENKAGKYVEPTIASGQAALASVEAAGRPDRLGAGSRGRRRRIRSSPTPGSWRYKKYADAQEGRDAEGRADATA